MAQEREAASHIHSQEAEMNAGAQLSPLYVALHRLPSEWFH